MRLPFISRKRAQELIEIELDRFMLALQAKRTETLPFKHDGCPVIDGLVLVSTAREELRKTVQNINGNLS